jgi:acyl-[acyl-carrier-protein]-phospholipid O-acyltransferase/long-chain-fatty-acid--[acyl-carrier-protein] ligase
MSFYGYLSERIRANKPYDYSDIRDRIARDDFVFENDAALVESFPEINGNLADYAFRTLAGNPFRIILTDYTTDKPKKIRAFLMLALSLLVAKKIKENIGERRIGIALPAGAGSHIANIAMFLANKIPVNLNFTLGRNSIESAIGQSGIRTVLTADAVIDKFRQFPWPNNVLDMSKIVSGLSKFSILRVAAEICTIPTKILAKRYDVPMADSDSEATILFSSGTTEKPKGVILSHKNIISNCLQLWLTGLLNKRDSVLASLPVFHSFGMTINIWFCLLFGVRIATCTNPMEVKKISSIIEREKLTANLGTPTFFKQYIGKVNHRQLRSLRASVAGGERVTLDTIDSWEKIFQTEMIAGYGLTEASPVVSINFPLSSGARSVTNNRRGSVGRILPGISVKFIGPETGKPMPLGETGILCLKGPNIFSGYMNDEENTAKALLDGWLVTGDLARLDADGFLHIDGRVSRFSKIGGEMVPHVGVEEAISRVLALTHEDGPEIAVLSKIDRKKGESLVLLSECELDMRTLREKLLHCGLSPLWIPREHILVDDIPSLATGKLDLGTCKQLMESKLSERCS